MDRQRTRIWTTLYLHMYTIFVETLIIFRLRLHPAPFRASTQFIDGSLWNSLRPGNGFWTIKLWIPFCLLYRTVTRSIFLLDRHLAGITSFLPRLTRLSTLFCHIKLDWTETKFLLLFSRRFNRRTLVFTAPRCWICLELIWNTGLKKKIIKSSYRSYYLQDITFKANIFNAYGYITRYIVFTDTLKRIADIQKCAL